MTSGVNLSYWPTPVTGGAVPSIATAVDTIPPAGPREGTERNVIMTCGHGSIMME
jgi:hypothetical protein